MYYVGMFLLGMFAYVTFCVYIDYYLNTKEKVESFIYLGVFIILSICVCLYDYTSPLETKQKIIYTNDIEKYIDIESNSDKMYKIKRIDKTPTRFMAVYKWNTQYILLDN